MLREPGHAVGDEPVGGAGDGAPVDRLHGLKPQGRAAGEGEPVRDLGGRLGFDRRLEQPEAGAAAAAKAGLVTEPIGPGAFVAVVGASGAGKDALLSYARERGDTFARFPPRAITRPPGPGEDHDPVTEDQFATARDRGAFAVYWRAHGLCYGLPASVDAEVRDGLVIVANVSRGVIDELDARYRRLVVVHVAVPEEVLSCCASFATPPVAR